MSFFHRCFNSQKKIQCFDLFFLLATLATGIAVAGASYSVLRFSELTDQNHSLDLAVVPFQNNLINEMYRAANATVMLLQIGNLCDFQQNCFHSASQQIIDSMMGFANATIVQTNQQDLLLPVVSHIDFEGSANNNTDFIGEHYPSIQSPSQETTLARSLLISYAQKACGKIEMARASSQIVSYAFASCHDLGHVLVLEQETFSRVTINGQQRWQAKSTQTKNDNDVLIKMNHTNITNTNWYYSHSTSFQLGNRHFYVRTQIALKEIQYSYRPAFTAFFVTFFFLLNIAAHFSSLQLFKKNMIRKQNQIVGRYVVWTTAILRELEKLLADIYTDLPPGQGRCLTYLARTNVMCGISYILANSSALRPIVKTGIASKYIRRIVYEFQKAIGKQRVHLKINPQVENMEVVTDWGKVQSIVASGMQIVLDGQQPASQIQITIGPSVDKANIIITISDDGGPCQNLLNTPFRSFEMEADDEKKSVDNYPDANNWKLKSLGLLAEQLHGYAELRNRTDQRGRIFILSVPKGNIREQTATSGNDVFIDIEDVSFPQSEGELSGMSNLSNSEDKNMVANV